MWMPINAVVFDLGGTLIEYAGEHDRWPDLETPGLEAAHARLAEAGVELPPLKRFVMTGYDVLPGRWRQATSGRQNLTVPDLLAEILAQFKLPRPPDESLEAAARVYEEAVCERAEPIPHGREILAELKEQGYLLGLLSNTMFTGRAHVEDLRRFGLDGYFDTMLFSADVNLWKPTPGPFEKVLADLGVAADEAVYIGDDPAADIVGARRAGLLSVYFHSGRRARSLDGAMPDVTIRSLRELPGALAFK
jgi:HAD superfamily hydrolase (TIGR01509 family)